MLIKSADPKGDWVEELETLITRAHPKDRDRLEWAIRKIRAGIKAESEAAYFIDFDYANSEKVVILHDLRFEANGRVAQIDHLLITRALDFFVLETKNFHSGLKITENGEFLRWNDFSKRYEGMPSPIHQNERHISVIKDIFNIIKMPTFLGKRVTPKCFNLILVSAQARIDRPKNFDSRQVISMDRLKEAIGQEIAQESIFDSLKSATRWVDQGTLVALGRQLLAQHRPLRQGWANRFGLQDVPQSQEAPGAASPEVSEKILPPSPVLRLKNHSQPCPHCQALGGSILYGRHGYFLKCVTCGQNSSVKGHCQHPEHQAKLRKSGREFFNECPHCGRSELWHINPEA